MEKKNLIIIVVTHFLSYKKIKKQIEQENTKIQNDIHEEIPKNCPS
jgi:hypothetical protein